MNGVTYMLPFVVGGGILLAVSFLFENVLGSDSEIFKFLNTLGGNAFNFLIPILAGYIAVSVGDRLALMPGMVGGLMAVHSNAGFLGGLAAGFLAGYIVIWMRKLFRGIPQSLEGLKPIFIYPVVGLFLIGTLMYFIVGPIFSIINTAMIDFLNGLGTANKVLLGAVLGGMMATDMGGPFNKAYTFSIGIFTETGDGTLMAAVMDGGMVPPLAIALATTIFKNKFNEAKKAFRCIELHLRTFLYHGRGYSLRGNRSFTSHRFLHPGFSDRRWTHTIMEYFHTRSARWYLCNSFS